MITTRSRGQLARRHSHSLQRTSSRTSSSGGNATSPSRGDPASSDLLAVPTSSELQARRNASLKRKRRNVAYSQKGDNPLVGGMYFSDLIVIAFTYALNLFRTMGLAELLDIVLKGIAYVLFSLPTEFYARWNAKDSKHTVSTRKRASVSSATEPYAQSSIRPRRSGWFTSHPQPGASRSYTSRAAAVAAAKNDQPLFSDSTEPAAAGSVHSFSTSTEPDTASDSDSTAIAPSSWSWVRRQMQLRQQQAAQQFRPRWNTKSGPGDETDEQSRDDEEHGTPDEFKSAVQVAAAAVREQEQAGDDAFASSSKDLLPAHVSPAQLSPFHHLAIILVRFACGNFPHLLPRVLFAEETIGPLVRWRTGGGAASLVREFGPDKPRAGSGAQNASVEDDDEDDGFWADQPEEDDGSDDVKTGSSGKTKENNSRDKTRSIPKEGLGGTKGFKAFWIGGDSQLPNDIRRSSDSARQATTILYLHGGGMTLGSVAFYAEALIRILAKVCAIERRGGLSSAHRAAAAAASAGGLSGAASASGAVTQAYSSRRMAQVEPGEARCIAVEYTLSPAVRFPGALLECLRCYAHLIEVERIDPESIVIAGDSAGANLAMSVMLCLSGQAEGPQQVGGLGEEILKEREWSKLPMPGKAVLISPWCDLRPSYARAFETLRKVPADTDDPDTLKGTDRETSIGSAGGKARRARSSASTHSEKGKARAPRAARRGRASRSRAASGTMDWEEDSQKEGGTDAPSIEDPHRWDYVLPETLLHFAQVYSGVLQRPRRVRGPVGWISHMFRVLSEGYPDVKNTPRTPTSPSQAQSTKQSPPGRRQSVSGSSSYASTFMDPPKQLAALAQAPRRWAKTVSRMLDEPMFLKKPLDGENTQQQVARAFTQASDAYLGLHPLFAAAERDTITVADKSQLFVPFEETMGANPGCMRLGEEVKAMATAAMELDHNPLISPAIGDWSKVRLSKGALVVWGERELMSEDIELWVQKVRRESMNKSDTGFSADSAGSQGSKAASGDWIHAAVEKGPAGVHAWPLVSMYLAGTESEREKGLDLLARFIARKDTGSHLAGAMAESLLDPITASGTDSPSQNAPESPLHSPGSMPSDAGLYEDEELLQVNAEDLNRRLSENQLHLQGVTYRGAAYDYSAASTTSTDDSSSLDETQRAPAEHGLAIQIPGQQNRAQTPPRLPNPNEASTSSLGSQQDYFSQTPRQSDYVQTLGGSIVPASSDLSPVYLKEVTRGRSITPSRPIWWESMQRDSASSSSTVNSIGSPDQQTQDASTSRQDVAEHTPPTAPAFQPVSTFSDEDSDGNSNVPSYPAPSRPVPVVNTGVDAGFYGLSHYSLRQRELEGLSDITEEDSNMSSSVASAGDGAASPIQQESLQGFGVAGDALRALLSDREAQWQRSLQAQRSGALNTDEGEMGDGSDDEPESSSMASALPSVSDMAFSPPAAPQPGRAIPVVPSATARLSTDNLSTKTADSEESGVGTPIRKKPKGDVWW